MNNSLRPRPKFSSGLELYLWLTSFVVCFIFQFWRGSPLDGWIFVIFSIILVATAFSRGDNPGDQVKESHSTVNRSKAFNRSRLIWIGIAVTFCGWELYSYIAGYIAKNENAYPTVSLLVYPFTSHLVGMGIFLSLYLWLGRFLLLPRSQN